ncbi:MAG: DUF4270 family protein [bacterium]|nr:DUF4270 family protein [bacterium]
MTVLLLAFFQCKKDHNVLGIEVQPEDDKLGAQYFPNLQVYAHTIGYDSINSFNSSIKYLGSNSDPYFGNLNVGLYMNSNMTVNNLDFGPTAFVTSAEIVLAINNLDYAGDKNAALTYSVYALDSLLSPTRSYYSNNFKLYNKNKLLSVSTSTFSQKDNILSLRFPVDSNYANQILQNPKYLISNTVFQDTYRGFYVTASSGTGEGVIYDCDLDHPSSGFYLYYRASAAPADTIQRFQFTFSGSSSAKFNTSKFQPNQSLNNQMKGDTSLGAEAVFLKGMGATRLKVQIPDLKYRSDSFAVNRAEVIFNVDPTFAAGTGNYNLPPKLALLPMDSLGRETLSVDQSNTINMTRYDGYYDLANKRYIFNIPLHAQAIFRGKKKNHGFYLVVADPLPPYTIRRDNSIDRVIFAGSNKTLKPVLNLSYTLLKK